MITYYVLSHEYDIAWNDQTIGINWPDTISPLRLSEKDAVASACNQARRHF